MPSPTPSSFPTEHVDGVVVVGGGYAGLHAVRPVREAGLRTTIVNPHRRHDFVTRLAAVAGGTAPVRDASCPLIRFCDEAIVGSATSIGDGSVTIDGGRTITADAVVVTSGSVPAAPPIEGLDHALTLRTATDALRIRELVEAGDRVVVIGGGPSGVQLAGAIGAAHREVDVVVVDAEQQLLSSMKSGLAEGAERILRDRGVDVRSGATVEEIRPDSVVVDGEEIPGHPIWTGGFRPSGVDLGVDVDDGGRILVDERLRVMGMSTTFAAGDVASHLDRDGSPLPMSAQIAVQAGTQAGENAVRIVRGEPPERSSLTQRGWVLDLGGSRGLAEFGPVQLSSRVVDLLPPIVHELIDVKNRLEIAGPSGLTL